MEQRKAHVWAVTDAQELEIYNTFPPVYTDVKFRLNNGCEYTANIYKTHSGREVYAVDLKNTSRNEKYWKKYVVDFYAQDSNTAESILEQVRQWFFSKYEII